MKVLHSIILYLLIFGFGTQNSVAAKRSVVSYGIEDGWYRATVVYFNYNTGTRSTYTLNVEVDNDRVVTIDFGDGSVHTGFNNSGYTYSGGYLSYSKDYQGYISSAESRVSIYTRSGLVTFDVTIE